MQRGSKREGRPLCRTLQKNVVRGIESLLQAYTYENAPTSLIDHGDN